jgi:hypothetical protein
MREPRLCGWKFGLAGGHRRNLSTDKPSPKLASRHHGPFRIKEKLSNLTYQLELLPQWKIHDVFHVSVLSKAKAYAILNCWNLPRPLVKVNNDDFWVIEKYVNSQRFRNRFQFKIWWAMGGI